MNSHAVAISEYDRRIQRAEWLIAQKSAASELLAFYRQIAGYQKALLQHIAANVRVEEKDRFQPIRDGINLTFILPEYRSFLLLVAEKAPAALAMAARELVESSSQRWLQLLKEHRQNGGTSNSKGEAFERFFARAFLEPYASFLAANHSASDANRAPSACATCGGQPVFGVLRREGDGAKRFLTCSFCGCEWEFRRILCPACGEEDEKHLPVFQAEVFPHIRIEACDTCKFCLRTIDLTKDGRAVPVVDDLGAISLTLWAHEHGYDRLQENLLGS